MVLAIWRRLQHLLHRRRFEQDLANEMRLHRELRARKLEGGGASAAEAARAAQRQFGNATLFAEDSRAAWSFAAIESILQDVRYALRAFRRAPLFACGVAGTIGLGMGLICALFTMFNAYVLRPHAIRDPYSLYEFRWRTRTARFTGFSWREFEQLRTDTSVFSEVLASSPAFVALDGRPSPGTLVSGNYFSSLGVQTAIGRTILPEDASAPGSQPVVVLSYRAWQNRFAGDPNILGRKVTILGYPFEIVGVASREFSGLDGWSIKSFAPDFWAPITMARQFYGYDLFADAGRGGFAVIGRVQPGMPVRQARSMLESFARSVTAGLPENQQLTSSTLESRATAIPLTPGLIAGFSAVLVVFGLVLLIACANVANMMLARALSREREISVRLSLGASRSRIMRQLLTESFLLSIPGAFVGFTIAAILARFGPQWFLAALHAPTFAAIVRLPPLDPDFRVFAFAFAVAAVATVCFGLAPAFHATREKGGATGDHRAARLRNGLVMTQVTVCVLFLVSAGILLRGSRQLAERNTGMDLARVAAVAVDSPGESSTPGVASSPERLRAEAWVERTATATRLPLGLGVPEVSVSPSSSAILLRAEYNFVSPDYFAVLGIPLRRGRSFSVPETETGAPVAIVSEATARRLWPGQDPIGQSLALRWDSQTKPADRLPGGNTVSVIAVAADSISGWIYDRLDANTIYFPTGPQTVRSAFLVRVRTSAEAARRPFAAAAARIAPAATWRFTPLQETADTTMMPFRTVSLIAWILGCIALLLTISGMYGVMSYVVSQRTREIGIRMALGAGKTAVTRNILGQAFRLATTGAAIGLLLSLALSRLMAANLDMVDTFDRVAYLGGITTVALATLAAAYFPSRRAIRVDPATTLRAD